MSADRTGADAHRAEVEAEQVALRRVATLVARGTEPVTVFWAVCDEVQVLLGAERGVILRFHDDRTVTVMANSGGPGEHAVGARVSFDPGFVVDWVHETNQAARFDTADPAAAEMPEVVRLAGIRSAVGSPIVVDGELWGVILLASLYRSLPLGIERRLAEFTELVATAIANAESKSALDASRRRIVAASDEARRRVTRDLHDGAQQRIVALALKTRLLAQSQAAQTAGLDAELRSLEVELNGVLEELRTVASGLHPAALSHGGLAAALSTLAQRSPVPVVLDVRLPERVTGSVEVAAYYVVAETLTNTTKHAEASRVDVTVELRDDGLWLRVRDDGVGGADPACGSGLVGLKDRIEAFGGTMTVDSPPGGGTTLVAQLPLPEGPAFEAEPATT